MKICATTLGETAGDLLSMTLNVGYGVSTLILLGLFVVTLVCQLAAKSYHPFLYWTVILSTSTAGTTMSDYMDRTLGLGYAAGSLILVTILAAILALWRLTVGTLSVSDIRTFKVESFYWTAILFSNTLGTALGDFLADSSGLGFAGGALLIAGLIALIALANLYTEMSKTLLFWMAFRPDPSPRRDHGRRPHQDPCARWPWLRHDRLVPGPGIDPDLPYRVRRQKQDGQRPQPSS